MTKEQCEAIVKAIQAAANFLFLNGVKNWDPVGDASANATALGAASAAFDTAIEAIINDIPDDNSP